MAVATLTRVSRRKEFTELKTPIFDAGKLDLYQNDFTPNDQTVLADLTVADFTGYAQVSLTTYVAPYTEPDGKAVITTPQAVFASSGSAVQNVVYGWYVLDADGDLLAAGRFDDALNFSGVGDAVVMHVEFYSNGTVAAVIV
jgi:hypothetical protein